MSKNDTKSTPMQQVRNPDRQLWRQVKAAAAMEGKTITLWVEEALRKQLALTNKSKKEAT